MQLLLLHLLLPPVQMPFLLLDWYFLPVYLTSQLFSFLKCVGFLQEGLQDSECTFLGCTKEGLKGHLHRG